MTVLQLLSSGIGFYGAERVSVTLSSELLKIGIRPVVVAFRNCAKDVHLEVLDVARGNGLATEELDCRGRIDRRCIQALREVIIRHDVDVIHTHGVKPELYALLARKRGSPPIVGTCHSLTATSTRDRILSLTERLLLRGLDVVVPVSDVLVSKLRRFGIRSERIRVVPNGIDCEPFVRVSETVLQRTAFDGLVVGAVGRLTPVKGLNYLLEAVPHILQIYPSTRFVIVGSGPEAEALRTQAERLGITSSVQFAGACMDMPARYAAFDIFVLPSISEAMPMALLEAMAAGKPGVATAVGSVPSVVENGKTAILVAPGNPSSLAAGICGLLGNDGVRRAMGRAAQRTVLARYSASEMARRYLAIYEFLAVRNELARVSVN